MHVFIVVESDGYNSEDIRGVFLNLDQAVNNAVGAIRIEEHSTEFLANQWVTIYSINGEQINKNTV